MATKTKPKGEETPVEKTETPEPEKAEETTPAPAPRSPRPKRLDPGVALSRKGRVVGPVGGAVVHVQLEGEDKTVCGLDPKTWIKGEIVPEDGLYTCPICARILAEMEAAEAAATEATPSK